VTSVRYRPVRFVIQCSSAPQTRFVLATHIKEHTRESTTIF